MSRDFSYYAFISYSHKDEAFAKKLQHYLEHYKLPSVLCRKYPHLPKPLRPIFRDSTDLPIARIQKSILDALRSSRFLIVICSESSAKPNAEGKNWIDWEIENFIGMKPDNVENVIPILFRKDESVNTQACLPPTVKKHEILAADVFFKGEARVPSDTFATMVLLMPDVLWNRHARELRRKRVLRRLSISVAALTAALGGWFYWDYYVPHVTYYRDYIERNNIPEGLFELTDEEIAQRKHHYRFTTHQHRLRTVEYCNADGDPIEHTFIWNKERPSAMQLKYPEGLNEPSHRINNDAKGQERMKLVFSHGCIDFVQTTADGIEIAHTIAPLTPGIKSSVGKPSDIGRYVVRRQPNGPARGIIIQELYHKSRSITPTTDAAGMSGRAYELDDLGRVIGVRFLGRQSDADRPDEIVPFETASGVGGYRIAYGQEEHNRGLISSVTYTDKTGQPALNDEHWSKIVFHYDAAGKLTGQTYHKSQNTAGLVKDEDNPLWSSRYDERGNMIERVYHGKTGSPAVSEYGFTGWQAKYDEKNNETERLFYGPDGRPCMIKDGYARRTVTYDRQSNILQIAYYDVADNLCAMIEGFARVQASYDAEGNRIETSYWAADGQPAPCADGFASQTNKYDENGNLTESAYYGADGKPMAIAEGFHRKTMRYNENGDTLEYAFYGPDNRPCLNTEGIHRCATQYDTNGCVTEIAYFDADNKLCMISEGYARVKTRYNERGNEVEIAYYGTDNRPCLCHDGYALWQADYNERGYPVKESFYGADARLCLHRNGYAFRTSAYDAHGNLIEQRYFGIDGKPCMNNNGYARWIAKYDERGNIIEMAYFDTTGSPCADATGAARIRRIYDAQGNCATETRYDAAGRPLPRQ